MSSIKQNLLPPAYFTHTYFRICVRRKGKTYEERGIWFLCASVAIDHLLKHIEILKEKGKCEVWLEFK